MSKKLLTAFLLITLCGVFPSRVWAQNNGQTLADMSMEVLRLVNGYRAEKKLPPLKMNDIIVQGAEKHSRNMASKKIPFGHEGFDERMAKISKQLHRCNAFAENVAYGAKTSREVMDMWLHSAGHRENIEGNYNLTGIGIAKGSDGNLYFTEIFMQCGE